MYIVIEMADVELLGVRLFEELGAATKVFEACMEENKATEHWEADLGYEVSGTLRTAGDDSYSVQLIGRDVLRDAMSNSREVALAEYRKVVDPAYAEFEKARDLADAKYRKVRELAQAENDKVIGLAQAENDKVIGLALDKYEKVRELAQAKFNRSFKPLSRG